MVEPGATCACHADELSMVIHANLTWPGADTPVFARDFASSRTQAAANPNQHEPLYAECAKSQAGPM